MPQTTELGRIRPLGERTVLEFDRYLPHPPAVVWAAITEPAQRAAWIGPSRVEATVGGTISTDPDDPPVRAEAKRMTGTVLTWEPDRLFEHTWNQRIVEPGAVRYELAPEGDGTRLTFRHTGLGRKNAAGFIPGTHAYLDRLAAHLDGAPVPSWRERFAALAPEYAQGA